MFNRYKYIAVSNYIEIGEGMEIPDPIKKDVESIGGLEEIPRRVPDQQEIEELSKIFKSLSDPLRLRIVYMLDVQPLCVCCIKELVEISDSKLSYHLNQLKEAGLIEGRQEKNWIIYRTTEVFHKISEMGVKQ
jgi:ArsR family transcriptional regulator